MVERITLQALSPRRALPAAVQAPAPSRPRPLALGADVMQLGARRPEAPRPTAPLSTFNEINEDLLDGDPIKDAFKDPKKYVRGVEFAESQLRPARAALVAAVAAFARADAETGAALAAATGARDAKKAEASKPLAAAMQAVAEQDALLGPAIETLKPRVADARQALERATYPNKPEVDAGREAARADVGRKGTQLQQAQATLAGLEGRVRSTRDDLSRVRARIEGERSELSRTRMQLDQAHRDLEWARRDLPSSWEYDASRRRLQDAQAVYREADREYGYKKGHIDTCNRELARLYRQAQQANPPADIQSQIAHWQGELGQARQAYDVARRNRDDAARRLDVARREFERLAERFNLVERLEERVRGLEREIWQGQSTIGQLQGQETSLSYSLQDLEGRVPAAREGVDNASRELDGAKRELDRWLATPYQAGNAAAIAAARQTLDKLSNELARLETNYNAVVGPLRAAVAREQAAFDAVMAPLESQVNAARARREQAMAPLQAGVDNAKPPVAAGEALIAKLKALPAEKAEEWKRKKKFDVVEFWRTRPPV